MPVPTKAAARTYYRKRYDERITYALAKLGGKCVDCGSTDRLEFDHVRGIKYAKVTSLVLYSFEIFDSEVAKCVLRCNACHHNRHKGPVPHGTLAGYNRHGCRCATCKAFKSDYARTYKTRTCS